MANNKFLNETIVKIKKVLKSEIPDITNVNVEISRGLPSKIHIIIISNFFKGKNIKTRQDYVWKILEKNLNRGEILRISLCLTLTEKEAKEDLVYV